MSRHIPDQDHFASGEIRPSRSGKGSKRRPVQDEYALPPEVQEEVWLRISSKHRKLKGEGGC